MTPEEIHRREPQAPPPDGRTPLELARERMRGAGQWHAGQAIGRRYAVGCVALEVTQRCNLKRDELLLRPIELGRAEKVRFWNPVTGALTDEPPARIEVRHTRKTARGRTRQAQSTARLARG
jgi:hypothetical protein